MTISVTMIDAGTGNLRSVYKALESVGASVTLTNDPKVVLRGSRVVLPGVGAFGDFMKGLLSSELAEAVMEIAQSSRPLLGICVGMQAFFEIGEEMGEHMGLGLLPGRVVCFPSMPGLKIPHTGWNQLIIRGSSPLLNGISERDYAYFNHSFYCLPENSADISASTDYGILFASAIQRQNIYGVQFHPEKSQLVGLKLLANFLHC